MTSLARLFLTEVSVLSRRPTGELPAPARRDSGEPQAPARRRNAAACRIPETSPSHGRPPVSTGARPSAFLGLFFGPNSLVSLVFFAF